MTTTRDEYPLLVVAQTIEVNDVSAIVETDPVHEEGSDWIREIQIFREPDEGSSNPKLVLTIRLKGGYKENIYFHAPSQDY